MSLLSAVLFLLPSLSYAVVDLKPYNVTAAKFFSGIDQNGDGVILRPEIDTYFESFDADHNDDVTVDEFTNFVCRNYGEFAGYEKQFHDYFDANKDNILTDTDFETLIGAADVDGDGKVTKEEFEQFFVLALQALETLLGPTPPSKSTCP